VPDFGSRFSVYDKTFPMLELIPIGSDALVTSLRVYAVRQAALTFLLQTGRFLFWLLTHVNTMLVDVAIALNPAGGFENMYGTATVTLAGSEWTVLPMLALAFTTRL
jgi:hypothetical protein